MSEPILNRQWIVAEHPTTTLEKNHFGYQEEPVRPIQEGEVLLKTHLLNIAPVMRMYMMRDGAAGEMPLSIGDVIHGRGVAQVVASKHPDYAVGEFLQGQIGWQTYKISEISEQEKFRRLNIHELPIHYALSVFGVTGFSAYCGFVSRAQPKAGEAVLISGAAGGVGSIVVQLAKQIGCHPIVGIAGGAQKCEVIRELGCDVSIDYQNDNVPEQLAAHFPSGLDIYFDNVGGEILEAAIDNLAPKARIVLCGAISEYQQAQPTGPRNYQKLSNVNADMLGFFVYNHPTEFDGAEQQMAQWVRQGALKVVADIIEGFEHMPKALMEMYSGTQGGKRLVKVEPGPIAIY